MQVQKHLSEDILEPNDAERSIARLMEDKQEILQVVDADGGEGQIPNELFELLDSFSRGTDLLYEGPGPSRTLQLRRLGDAGALPGLREGCGSSFGAIRDWPEIFALL